MGAGLQRWMEHVRRLSEEVGPRGPATEGERRGLGYCGQVLRDLGLAVREDRFPSAGSVFRPHLVAAAGILLAFALYRLAPSLAASLVAVVLVSEVRELTLRPNLLQVVLPKRESGNVFAVLEGPGDPGAARDVVLMGHVDTQRTPIIFSSPGWFAFYRAFSTAAFGSFVLMTLIYAGGAAFGWAWVWPVSAVPAGLAAVLAAICIEAELSPHTPGANDNASGAGLVLALAEEAAANPPPGVRLWLVCTGSEESLHEGARAFFARHRGQMRRPLAMVLEMLAASGPGWMESEGIVLRIPSDPRLRRLAAAVAERHPELGAYPAKLEGGVTEMADALAAGIPAITIIGLTRDGKAPYWHLPSDTADKMVPEAMDRNLRFVRTMLQEMGRLDG